MHHPKTLPKIEVVSAREFFTWICPAVLHASGHACMELGGRFAFEVVGAGRWTIDLDNVAVEPIFDPSADVRLRLSGDDFLRLLRGAADLSHIAIEGDASLLSRLAILFAPPPDEVGDVAR